MYICDIWNRVLVKVCFFSYNTSEYSCDSNLLVTTPPQVQLVRRWEGFGATLLIFRDYPTVYGGMIQYHFELAYISYSLPNLQT